MQSGRSVRYLRQDVGWVWWPASIGEPYSLDLRERVLAAVETDGMSRNKAAAYYGVSISTAINGVKAFRTTGSLAPGQMAGKLLRRYTPLKCANDVKNSGHDQR